MVDNYISRQVERGSINISEDVIEVMVKAAVSEIEGVAGLTSNISAEIADFIGRKNVHKGIKIQFENGSIIIDVVVMVRFGTNISEVGAKIQEAISSAVDSMAGMPCVVNVNISGIAYDK